ncbi:helix-turn-helix domain-containing protein [Jatrophihabitans sp. YIM 134969]
MTATALGSTLRAWRDRLTPAAAGLPSGHARRAAGLRREELADLAGLSVDYVVRLEQGRATTPSAQVAAALARALRLTDEERDHLYRLAQLAPPTDGRVSDHIPPGVHRMLSRLGDAAVAVFAADWQLIWTNRLWTALLGDPTVFAPHRRNFARDVFPVDDHVPVMSQWPMSTDDDELTRVAVVSDLRRATGRFPDDPRLAGLVHTLQQGNPRFAELWAAATVGAHHEERKVVTHPAVGPVTIDCDVLTDGGAELKIVVLTAEPGTEDETKLRLIGVAGVPERVVVEG